MPIIGIDLEKCTNCKDCVNICVRRNYRITEGQNQVKFDDSRDCILCGHCISVCPENAIIYEDMGDEAMEYQKKQSPSELIPYSTLQQFLRTKRSVRKYKEDKVPKELIEKVLNTMRYAPTGTNRRTMSCHVISNEETIKTLVDSIVEHRESEEDIRRLRKLREKGIDTIFYDAPHVLILYSKYPWDSRNAAIAITYGMLSAHSLGLGTCWIGMAHGTLNENPKILSEIAGINDQVLAVMTLGYPAVNYFRAPPRPPIETTGLDDKK
jgi:nitroreductase/NAD-dependent dihydropyrimidine dehydrogenase PreA subunit